MPKTITGESLDNVSHAAWEKLAGKRIFFGHQSVGHNIVDGMGVLLKEHPAIRLKIVESDDPSLFDAPAFFHGKVGQNGDPGSKCAAFEHILGKGVGSRADIAFFKFCYLDISSETDAGKAFETYQKMHQRVKAKYPNLTVVHVTAPLTRFDTGPKAWFKTLGKRLLGKKGSSEHANVGRNRLNDLIRKEYEGRDPVFDLAAIESVAPTGEPAMFSYGGQVVPSLYPGFTSDGGHLNETGKRVVAERLLVLLAKIADKNK